MEVIVQPMSDDESSAFTTWKLLHEWWALRLQICIIPGQIYYSVELGNKRTATVVDALILTVSFSAGCARR
jgi:hypothetical protein